MSNAGIVRAQAASHGRGPSPWTRSAFASGTSLEGRPFPLRCTFEFSRDTDLSHYPFIQPLSCQPLS